MLKRADEVVTENYRKIEKALKGATEAKRASMIQEFSLDKAFNPDGTLKADFLTGESSASAESDGEFKHSIKKSTDGEMFVDVENTSFTKKTAPRDIAKALSNIVRTKFTDLVEVNGQQIGINQKTAREWANSKNAQNLYNYNPDVYTDKANAFENADELLQASRDYISETLKHTRKDNFVGFARGVVNFKVGNNGYEADVIVGTTKSGKANLYDVVNIQRKTITADTSIQENGASAHNPVEHDVSAAIGGSDATTNSIPNSGEIVNPSDEIFSKSAKTPQNSQEATEAPTEEQTVKEEPKMQNSASKRLESEFYSVELRGRENEIRADLKKLSEDTGEEIRPFHGKLTEEGEKNFRSFKKALTSLNSEGGADVAWVVVEENSAFNGVISKNGVIYISADAIERGTAEGDLASFAGSA